MRNAGMLCLVMWLPFAVTAQELVRNGGFEHFRKCPAHFAKRPASQLMHVDALAGMPGFFHRCGEMMGAPANWAGVQEPAEGDGYAGLVLTAHGGGECAVRELLQLVLAEPLRNGGKYRVSFLVSAADRTGYVTDRIGATFTTERRKPKAGLNGLIGKAHVENPPDRFLNDTSGWVTVEGVYSATGGERFLVIGNLHGCDRASRKALTPNRGEGTVQNMKKRGVLDLDTDQERALRRRMLATQAYVYVDAVSVRSVDGFTDAPVLDRTTTCVDDPHPAHQGEELVPDPAFDHNVPAHTAHWRNASGGTPDLEAGQAGIYLYSAVNSDHREYIHTTLKEKLDPCGRYAFRIRVRRNASYAYAVDRIGIALAEDFANDRRREVLPLTPAWSTAGGPVMDHTTEWTSFCGAIDAPGCARTLIIGNFHDDAATTIVQRDPQGGPFAYYFVDDVSLRRTGTVEGCTLECPEPIIPLEPRPTTGIPPDTDPITLHFALADHVPEEDLADLCEKVLAALVQYPHATIEVEGHTDASGSREANLHLSERRAATVIHALVQAGVSRKRIRIQAHGAEQPLAGNETEVGRAMNRRVVVRVVP